jgi:hypothetical protein
MNELRRQESRFDELLVQLREKKDPRYRRWVRKGIKVGSITFMVLGALFLGFFLWKFTTIFVINRPADMTFATFWGNFGDAAGGAINMMGLGGLIYSLLFVAEQVQEAKEARLQHDMPVVFAAPRLAWSVSGAFENKLLDKNLELHVGFRNTSDAAATHLVFNICELTYRSEKAQSAAVFILRNEERLIDNLPGHEISERSDGADSYHILIDIPLKNKCPGLLDALFHQDLAQQDCPSLELRFTASFYTIRGASFYAHGSAVWSPKHCREVKDNKQTKFMDGFAEARKKFERGEGGLDEYFQGAEQNPLVPTITVLEEA